MFSLRKLWVYSWGTIFHPTRTFEAIVADGPLVYSTAAMTLIGFLYSILVVSIGRVRHLSMWKATPITLLAFVFAWAVQMTYLR